MRKRGFGKPCAESSAVCEGSRGVSGEAPRSWVKGRLRFFRSLAQRPLTQRRGDTLGHGSQGGSIALTAMQTGVFGRWTRVAVGEKRA